jgi:hypothetical protein
MFAKEARKQKKLHLNSSERPGGVKMKMDHIHHEDETSPRGNSDAKEILESVEEFCPPHVPNLSAEQDSYSFEQESDRFATPNSVDLGMVEVPFLMKKEPMKEFESVAVLRRFFRRVTAEKRRHSLVAGNPVFAAKFLDVVAEKNDVDYEHHLSFPTWEIGVGHDHGTAAINTSISTIGLETSFENDDEMQWCRFRQLCKGNFSIEKQQSRLVALEITGAECRSRQLCTGSFTVGIARNKLTTLETNVDEAYYFKKFCSEDDVLRLQSSELATSIWYPSFKTGLRETLSPLHPIFHSGISKLSASINEDSMISVAVALLVGVMFFLAIHDAGDELVYAFFAYLLRPLHVLFGF